MPSTSQPSPNDLCGVRMDSVRSKARFVHARLSMTIRHMAGAQDATALPAGKTALLVIDFQNEYFAGGRTPIPANWPLPTWCWSPRRAKSPSRVYHGSRRIWPDMR